MLTLLYCAFRETVISKCLFIEETTSDIVKKIFALFLSGKNMKEILEEYKKEICSRCKNKYTQLCEIRQCVDGTFRCIYYEREGKENDKRKFKI